MDLAKFSLCGSKIDYQLLLNTLVLIKNIIKCNSNNNIIADDAATCILRKLFYGDGISEQGTWYNQTGTHSGVFTDLNIYYNTSNCCVGVCPWVPTINHCLRSTITLVTGNSTYSVVGFESIMTPLAIWLGEASFSFPSSATMENTLMVIKAMCDVIKQRLEIEHILRKTVLTINDCEF